VTDWRDAPELNQGLAVFSLDSKDAIHFNANVEGLALVVTYDL